MKTTTSIKLDTETKEEASKLAELLGLSLSSVINASLKKFVHERRVVFSVAPEFNEKTEKLFTKLESDVQEGKNISKSYSSTEELKKALLS